MKKTQKLGINKGRNLGQVEEVEGKTNIKTLKQECARHVGEIARGQFMVDHSD